MYICAHLNIYRLTLKNIKPVSFLINKSISNRIFSTVLKLAKVIPIFKSGPFSEISNYHLISVLSLFVKIFKNVLYNHLINFIDKHNILYKFQFGFGIERLITNQQNIYRVTLVHYLQKAEKNTSERGFRKGHSTQQALITLVH